MAVSRFLESSYGIAAKAKARGRKISRLKTSLHSNAKLLQ